MNKNLLIDAITCLDSDIIANYQKYGARLKTQKNIKTKFAKWMVVAACLCIVIIGAVQFSIALIKNQSTDIYRRGEHYSSSMDEISSLYGSGWLVANIDDLKGKNVSVDLYCDKDGAKINSDDWYSVTLTSSNTNYRLTIYSLFDQSKDLSDWKIDSIFTEKATTTETINGVTVYFAEGGKSLLFSHKIYAIFEYDGVVYDIRVESDDCQAAKRMAWDMLEKIQ